MPLSSPRLHFVNTSPEYGRKQVQSRRLEMQRAEPPVQHRTVVALVGHRVDHRAQGQYPPPRSSGSGSAASMCSSLYNVSPRGPGRCDRMTPSPAPSRGWAATGWPEPAPSRWCARRTPAADHPPANHDVWQRYSNSAEPAPVPSSRHRRCCAGLSPPYRGRSAGRERARGTPPHSSRPSAAARRASLRRSTTDHPHVRYPGASGLSGNIAQR